MSTFVIITLLLSVPTIPLVLYAIGLLLPPEHIVTRSTKYKTTAEIVWTILTSVEDYPAWRSNIGQVTVEDDEGDFNKYEEKDRTEFVEYNTKKDKRTAVTHIEQEVERKLLRVVEEKSTLEDHPPTFTGSWSFVIEPLESERAILLKITEQGVIKKPMVRGLNKLIFGYHRRIDRFMKDLAKEIELGILEPKQDDKKEEEEQLDQINEEAEEESSGHEMGPDESVMESKANADKDWDIISEIYEKK
ncbi:hypothetical protein G6F56_003984 [Rhizopus delemar]|uniref:Coenzyme Q-binding protein COQ10 START domain-containing protein n=1 Tax=Rhizopus stolonifer TaxID=4846 RepID=A0A367KZ79_RHIST|nr:hypothetical protein G6F56_003984 [Rhizopus delemar]RCI07282.1 hypothetical protein CU098_013994 [Rhizopus stolonifer]